MRRLHLTAIIPPTGGDHVVHIRLTGGETVSVDRKDDAVALSLSIECRLVLTPLEAVELAEALEAAGSRR